MKQIIIGIAAIMMMSGWAETGWGQPPAPPVELPHLALRQAIQIALDKHPALQSAEFAVQGADARARQAEAPYYPQVGGTAIQTNGALRSNPLFRPSGSLISPNQSDVTVGVVASQTLYDFGQTGHRVDAQRADKARIEREGMARRAEVVLGVERAYMSVLKRKRLVEIAEQTVKERSLIKQQVEVLYRNQLKSKLDLGLVQVQLSDAEYLVIRARNNLKAAFAELNNAMGGEGAAEYILDDLPVTVEAPRALEGLVVEAVDRRPELLALKERVRTAESRIKATTSAGYPVLQAVGSAGDTEHISDRPKLQEGGWWGVGAAVSVPIFTGFLIQNQVAEATAQQREAQAAYRNAAQSVRLQVTDGFLDLVTLIEQIKVSQNLAGHAREALSLARQRYKLGLGTIVEVTQSESSLTEAETRLAETQYNAKIAEARLRYAVGKIYE